MFFLYDLSGRLLEVRKRDGSYWTQYFRLDGMLLAERRNGTNYRILTDHLGTPQKYMDHNGQLTAGARLRPFGDVEASSSVTLYLRLPGQYDDPDTQDLYQNGFRDYDPWAGRYIQSDPIGLRGGWPVRAPLGINAGR
ncbi:MAG: hypothetical protein KAR37_15510 [Alphaproteobacteria bacterium]|nr:hypothetical protein [Alphaproteobacteria bacterium]